jgi:thiamine biosynthesis lipoprotein ApbE
VSHAFWITSRAAGVVALLASSGAVTAGLLMSGRFVRRSIDLRATHEALALATLIALAVHAFVLLGDGFLSPSLADMKLDGGGLANGLFADALAGELTRYRGFAIDCAGDLRVGGLARRVHVASPFDGATLTTLRLTDAAVATSGIGRRSWIDDDGRPAHHLLDPSTGRPAFTGIVQATAVAPTAVEAEIRAKAALLSGPDHGRAWLRHGGVLVFDDGSTQHCQGGQPVPHRRLRRAA